MKELEMLSNNGKTHESQNTQNMPLVQGLTKDPETILAEAEALVASLRKQLARGTHNDVRAPEVPKVRVVEIGARIEHTLRSSVRTTDELAKSIGEPVEKVQTWIKANRAKLADIGTPAQARWVWRLGDSSSAKDLQAMVQRVITETPMTTAELVMVTGARMSRVNGVLVEIQRHQDVPIYNIGSKFRARWYIMPAHAERANLPPKVTRRK